MDKDKLKAYFAKRKLEGHNFKEAMMKQVTDNPKNKDMTQLEFNKKLEKEFKKREKEETKRTKGGGRAGGINPLRLVDKPFKKFNKGGRVKKKKIDGIAKKGKTKGRFI
mgnify:CR=1 FL=1|tara:strand:- start:432 stop:758 length:327 start_codon:yes stop_codon:yes gene_type:complete